MRSIRSFILAGVCVCAMTAVPALTGGFGYGLSGAAFAKGGEGGGNGGGGGNGNGGGNGGGGHGASNGNSGGNGHGYGHGRDGAPGHARGGRGESFDPGAGRSAAGSRSRSGANTLGALNAAHASDRARSRAAPNSAVGRIGTYQRSRDAALAITDPARSAAALASAVSALQQAFGRTLSPVQVDRVNALIDSRR